MNVIVLNVPRGGDGTVREGATVSGMESSAALRVAKGSAYLLAGQMVFNAVSIIGFMFVARGLTVNEMGVATALSLVITLGLVISGAGMPVAVVRFVSEARGRGERYDHFITATLLGGAVLASSYALVAALCFFASPGFLDQYGVSMDTLFLALLTVLTQGLSGSMYSILIGLNMMCGACLSYVASAIALPLAAALVAAGWGVRGYVLGWVSGGVAGSISSTAFLAKALKESITGVRGVREALETLLKFSWPILVTGLANYLFACFDTLVITFIGKPGELGLYSVALKAYSVITIVPLNVAMALYPYYGESYGREELDEIRAATFAVSRYLSFLFVPMALGLAVVAGPVMVLFAGESYAGSAPYLVVFSLFGALTAFAPMLDRLLLTFKKTKTYMLANMASVSSSLLFASTVLPSLGVLLTMALARGLASILLMLFYVVSTRSIATVDSRSLVKGLACGFIMASVIYSAKPWLGSSILSLAAYIALGALAYVASVKALRGLTHDDILLLSTVLPEKMKKLVMAIGRLIAS